MKCSVGWHVKIWQAFGVQIVVLFSRWLHGAFFVCKSASSGAENSVYAKSEKGEKQ